MRAADHAYGAIAFGVATMAEAMSWGKGNPAEANRAALATCSEHGNDCRIVANYANSCAALAAARGGHFTTGTGRSIRQAESSALSSCRSNWGVCVVDLSACSFPQRGRDLTSVSPASRP